MKKRNLKRIAACVLAAVLTLPGRMVSVQADTTAQAGTDGGQARVLVCLNVNQSSIDPYGISTMSDLDDITWDVLMDVSDVITLDEADNDNKKYSRSGAAANDSAAQKIALVTSNTMSTEALLAQMKAREDVLYAEADQLITLNDTQLNDDTYSAESSYKSAPLESLTYLKFQWFLKNDGKVGSGVAGMDIGNTQDLQGADDVILAVVDTGVDYNHAVLKNKMYDLSVSHQSLMDKTGCGRYGYNAADSDNAADPMDIHGHGTHVASTVGSDQSAGTIAGVMANVKLLGVRVFADANGAYTSDIARGLNWLIDAKSDGVNIRGLNYSVGGNNSSYFMKLIWEELDNNGITSIIAAGNDDYDLDKTNGSTYEKANSTIIVDAMNPNGTKAVFSNYGKNTTDIFSPGVQLLAAAWKGTESYYSFLTKEDNSTLTYEGFENADAVDDTDINGGLNFYICDDPTNPQLSTTPVATSDSQFFLGQKTMEIPAGDAMTIMSAPVDLTAMPGFSSTEKYSLNYQRILGTTSFEQDRTFAVSVKCTDGTYVKLDQKSALGFWRNDLFKLYDLKDSSGNDVTVDFASFQIRISVQGPSDYPLYFDCVGIGNGKTDYVFMSGTSMAAPTVTGVFGLLCAQFPAECSAKISARVVGSAVKRDALEDYCQTGGMVNVSKAVTNPAPVTQSTSLNADGTLTLEGWFYSESSDISESNVKIGDVAAQVVSYDAGNDSKAAKLIVKIPLGITGIQSVTVTRADGEACVKNTDFGNTSSKYEYCSLPSDLGENNVVFNNLLSYRNQLYMLTYIVENDEVSYRLYCYDDENDVWNGKGDIEGPKGTIISSIIGYQDGLVGIFADESSYTSELFTINPETLEVKIVAKNLPYKCSVFNYKGQVITFGGVIVGEDIIYNKTFRSINMETGDMTEVYTLDIEGDGVVSARVTVCADQIVIYDGTLINGEEVSSWDRIVMTDLKSTVIKSKPEELSDVVNVIMDSFGDGMIVHQSAMAVDGKEYDTWIYDPETNEMKPYDLSGNIALLQKSVQIAGDHLYVSGISYNEPELMCLKKLALSNITYGITYDLDGGVNDAGNPSTYSVVDEVTLQAPAKEGYEFLGWTYGDVTTPEKEVTIHKGSMGDKTYKANWKVLPGKKEIVIDQGDSFTEVSVDVDVEKLFDSILTAEEKALIEGGASSSLTLKITAKAESDLTAEELKKITESLNQNTLGKYYDFTFTLKVGNQTRKISSLSQTMKVTVKVPDALLNKDDTKTRTYRMIAVHEDGSVETITGTYDAATGKCVFGVKGFSTYALVYEDKINPTQPTTQSPTQSPTQPTTQSPTQPTTQPATQVPTQPITQVPTLAPQDVTTASTQETSTAVVVEDAQNNNNGTGASPQGGDTTNMMIWIMAFFLSAGIASVVVITKKRKTH